MDRASASYAVGSWLEYGQGRRNHLFISWHKVIPPTRHSALNSLKNNINKQCIVFKRGWHLKVTSVAKRECNKVSLSPKTSELMALTNKILLARPQVLIGADLIKEIGSFKNLGVYIDTQLKYNVQNRYIKSKLSQLCGVSFRVSKFLNYGAASNRYNLCMYSVVTYCIGVWGGVSQCTCQCNGLKITFKT